MNKSLTQLCVVELKERAGWYALGTGMFTLYLKKQYNLTDGQAGLIFQIFYAIMYFATLIGGSLADKYGRRKMIAAGLLMQAVGYILLPMNIILGMLAVVVGNGLFKPNITASVQAVCEDKGKNEEETDAAFQVFYLAINIGGLIGPGISSIFEERSMYGAMFACAYVPLILAFIWFLLIKKNIPDKVSEVVHVHVEPALQSLRNKCLKIVCAVAPAFWAAFHAGPTQLTFWAKFHTDRHIGKYTIPSGWFSASNSAYIIILTPAFILLFAAFDRIGKPVSIATKLFLGFVITGCSFAIMTVAAILYPEAMASWIYIASCWFVLTIGELFISPMGNSMFSQYAPPEKRGKYIGMWFTSISAGNIIGGLFGYFGEGLPKSVQFAAFTILPLVSAAVMFIKRHDMNAAFSRIKNTAEDSVIPPGRGTFFPRRRSFRSRPTSTAVAA